MLTNLTINTRRHEVWQIVPLLSEHLVTGALILKRPCDWSGWVLCGATGQATCPVLHRRFLDVSCVSLLREKASYTRRGTLAGSEQVCLLNKAWSPVSRVCAVQYGKWSNVTFDGRTLFCILRSERLFSAIQMEEGIIFEAAFRFS